jgi:hypothetical protein
VFVRVDCESFGRHREGESFTFGLSTGLHGELNSAWNFVRVDNLKSLCCALGALSSDKCSEPEYVLLNTEEAGVNNCLSVDFGVQAGNDSLLFEDLVKVLSVDARNA